MEAAEAQSESNEGNADMAKDCNLDSLVSAHSEDSSPANDYESGNASTIDARLEIAGKEGIGAANDYEDVSKGRKYESLDGALAIIYYKDPKTGNLKIYTEQKGPNYGDSTGDLRIMKNRGKIGLIGGVVGDEVRGEEPHEALKRETVEEIKDPAAAGMVVGKLDAKKELFGIFAETVDGKVVRNFVYLVELNSEKECRLMRGSGMTDDAGYLRELTDLDIRELRRRGDRFFAYNHGDIIETFLNEYAAQKPSYLKDIANPHRPFPKGDADLLTDSASSSGFQSL